LLSKQNWRAELGDEALKSGPEMSFVGMALPLSCDRKRLTGWASGPDGAVFGPAGVSEGASPDANPGEEMALGETSEVVSQNIDN
jgi:hypothetical protein